MEFDEVVAERNSCRAFLPTPISNEIIEQAVEAGRLSPSSKNAQQWKFIV